MVVFYYSNKILKNTSSTKRLTGSSDIKLPNSEFVNMAFVVSDEGCTITEIVNFQCICTTLCIFGISANFINMLIFYTQGFRNTVNIAFFGLAISDLCCLMALLWSSLCLNPVLNTPWFHLEVMYLTGGWPHICFSRITGFITVYVTAERYLSIALPLKVKHIITRKTTSGILCVIYFINIASLFPEYATSYLGYRFDSFRNETLIGILFTSKRKSLEGVVFVLNSMFGILSFVGVIIFTSLLVSKLGQSSKWRQEVTSTYSKREAMSNREKKTVKMVVLIASILIACYTPGAVIALASFIVGSELSIRGKYSNICKAVYSLAGTFQSINSSVNIFVYYSMSSVYRQTFHEVIFNCKSYRANPKT